MDLSIGVLIIGSLLWDKAREKWRNDRLNLAALSSVEAPIRYGKVSEKRGDTYTMVFSRGCRPGTAKAVGCLNRVRSGKDLIAEAEHLWTAERNKRPNGRLSADWGCVVLLCNPSSHIPDELREAWRGRISREQDYGNVPQEAHAGRLVTEDGLLDVSWPCDVDSAKPLGIDLLLATATHPTLQGTAKTYATPEMIASAWNADKEQNVDYFWKNRAHGIFTFEDDAILKLLSSPEPGQT